MFVLEKNGNLDFQIPVQENDELNNIKGNYILGIAKKCFFVHIQNDISYHERYFEEIYGKTTFNEIYEHVKNTSLYYQGAYYKFDNNMAYTFNLGIEKIKSYNIIYPLITNFFISGFEYDASKEIYENRDYKFIDLVDDNERAFSRVKDVISNEWYYESQYVQCRDCSEIAMLYYEILPYISFKTVKRYNIDDLKQLKKQLEEVNARVDSINKILAYCETAKQNTKVLDLIKKK